MKPHKHCLVCTLVDEYTRGYDLDKPEMRYMLTQEHTCGSTDDQLILDLEVK